MKRIYFVSIVIIVISCIILVNFLCNYNNNIIIRIKSSPNYTFKKIFNEVDSIKINSDSLFSITNIVVDNDRNIIICDFIGHQVVIYDYKGNYAGKLMHKGKGPGEVLDPLSMAIDEKNNIYIADNGTRRISILDSTKTFRNSFIITGGHIAPISMKVKEDFIYMGGYRMLDKTLIHKYSQSGKYINSFMDVPGELKNSKLGSSICYPFFDISKDKIFSTQAILYQVNKFDLDGKTKEHLSIVPDYYSELSDKTKEEFSTTLNTKLLLTFSKPNFISCVDSLLFVQIEMPRDEYGEGNYYQGAEYRIDIFKERNNEIIYSGVKSAYPLIFIDKRRHHFYFLSELNYSDNKYCIKIYELANCGIEKENGNYAKN